MSDTAFGSWSASHAGGRAQNEDAHLDRPELGLWVVADGAGGHRNGAIASRAVIDALATIPPGLSAAEAMAQVRLRLSAVDTTLRAGAAVLGDDAIIASTVVVLIARGAFFTCLWAGDSRAYLLRHGMLTQLTRDHSLVQELLDQGALVGEAEAHPQANVITRAIGGGEPLLLDKIAGTIEPGDRFLLCCDGISKTIPAEEIARLMTAPLDESAADRLINAALARAVSDNVTAVVIAEI
jgi:serine/threonine protein phosphatase PrpC